METSIWNLFNEQIADPEEYTRGQLHIKTLLCLRWDAWILSFVILAVFEPGSRFLFDTARCSLLLSDSRITIHE
jgi:hypothetical protein